jgi:hypothetical protein
MRSMAEPLVLYVVAGVVLVALFVWVAVVLATAPTAQDVPPQPLLPPARDKPEASAAAKARPPGPVVIKSAPPPPEPAVVNLPAPRPHLDSHQEIQDSASVPPADDKEST